MSESKDLDGGRLRRRSFLAAPLVAIHRVKEWKERARILEAVKIELELFRIFLRKAGIPTFSQARAAFRKGEKIRNVGSP